MPFTGAPTMKVLQVEALLESRRRARPLHRGRLGRDDASERQQRHDSERYRRQRLNLIEAELH